MTRYENELTDNEFQICELQMEKEALIQENTSLMEWNFMLNRLVHDMMLTQSNLLYHLFLTQQTKNEELCEVILQGDDKKTCFYTGLSTHKLFMCVYELLEPLMIEKNPRLSRSELLDEFLLVLMKLRLGIPHKDLARRFKKRENAVSEIFHKWIDVLSVELKCLISWPDDEKLHQCMPKCFQKHYSNVTCIIDCFEIFVQMPV